MNKLAFLDYLFYKVGFQRCSYQLQQQTQDGFMSKRRTYQDVGFSKDLRWLERANARTILANEIVFDFDPNKGESEEEFSKRVEEHIAQILNLRWDHWWLFASNRGPHLHCFLNELFFLTEQQRRMWRARLLTEHGADLLKASERTTIAAEFSLHWKSGKKKQYLQGTLEGGNNG